MKELQPQNFLRLIVFILWLLECKFYSPEESFSIGRLARWSGQTGRNVTATTQLDGIGNVGVHDKVGIAIANLGFEAGEELLLAAIPCDDDLDPCHLSAIGIGNDHL